MDEARERAGENLSDELAELVAAAADEFQERKERGEDPDPEEYADRHPEGAAVLRRVLGRFRADSRGGVTPPATPGVGSGPGDGGVLGDYRIIREVGRGGMGVVYEALQISLRRRVALKVLPFSAVLDPRHLQRFQAEAVAAAALDHPHVVRVHGAGSDRGVHFIAMQFVDGRTVAELIRQRRGEAGAPAGAADTTHTLRADGTSGAAAAVKPASGSRTPADAAYVERVAEWGVQAAEALEHAHALGIVHRDVKPGNLLVDGRGVLYVADFGLAKVAADPGVTGTGDLLGTPRYMSPEQAAARHNLVDHRSDIYSLGATLYELLTLTPAFDGPDRQSILSKVTSATFVAPRKLDRRIPRDLETVVLKAMEKDPSRRYQSARELADDLNRFLNREPVKAKRPGLLDRAAMWARRNRAAVAASAAFVLVTVAAVAGSVGWAARDREQRRADAEREEAVRRQEADRRIDDGLTEVEDLHTRGKWPTAREVVGALEPLLAASGVSADRAERVRAWRKDLDMVDRLAEIRLRNTAVRDGHFDDVGTDGEYATAFREYGIDVENLDPGRAAELVRARPVRVELAAALDDWADLRAAVRSHDGAAWHKRLLRVARDGDPHPTRVRLRDALLRRDLASLRELADSPVALNLHATTLVKLGGALERLGDRDGCVTLLRRTQLQYPADFWVNYKLALQLGRLSPPQLDEQLRCFTAAAAISPTSPGARLNLGYAFEQLGRWKEALASYREAIRLKPDYAEAHDNIGNALLRLGKPEEAVLSHREAIRLKPSLRNAHINLGNALMELGRLPEAVASYREALRLKADSAQTHVNLGNALLRMGKTEDGVASYREAIGLEPDLFEAHFNLGIALGRLKKLKEAEASNREAIRLKPDFAEAHNNLGNGLRDLDRHREAEACYREAIRLKPEYAAAHHNLGELLVECLGRPVEGEACYRKAIRLRPDLAEAHKGLGKALAAVGRFAEAVASYREALRIDPADAHAHYDMGCALMKSGWPEEAEASYRNAIVLDPAHAEARCNLGAVLRGRGAFAEALAEYRRGDELGRKRKGWRYPSEQWVREAERLVALEPKLPAVVGGTARPAGAAEALAFAELARARRWYAVSAKLYADALLIEPKLAWQLDGPRYNAACAAVLAGCGRGEDADTLGEDERHKWRQQALRWLSVELAGTKEAAKQPVALPEVRGALARWQATPRLAPVRDDAELKKLPEAEQAAWRKLWADVAALQARVEGPAVAPPPRQKKSP